MYVHAFHCNLCVDAMQALLLMYVWGICTMQQWLDEGLSSSTAYEDEAYEDTHDVTLLKSYCSRHQSHSELCF